MKGISNRQKMSFKPAEDRRKHVLRARAAAHAVSRRKDPRRQVKRHR